MHVVRPATENAFISLNLKAILKDVPEFASCFILINGLEGLTSDVDMDQGAAITVYGKRNSARQHYQGVLFGPKNLKNISPPSNSSPFNSAAVSTFQMPRQMR